MGQINTNNYPAVDSLLDADLLIVENATHGTGTTTPKQLRENAIGTDPLNTTAQTVTGAINEIFEMATDTVVGLELGKMTSFSDGTIVTDIDLHRAPVAGDRILFYHGTAVASPSSLTTYNDGVAVTTTIGDFSMTHPAGLTLMKCTELGESLRWQTVQDIADGGYTAGVGISINGTTINNSAPQLGDDIAYSQIDTVTSGALGYFSADADCLVMDFRTDAEPYNGGYTLRLTTTGASFKYAVLKDKAGNDYAEEIPSGSLVMCKSNVSGTGSEADPVVVTVLEIGNTEMAHDVVYSAFNLLSKSEVAESVPYLYRRSGGAVRDVALEHLKKVVGASVAVNQLIENSNFADGTTKWGTYGSQYVSLSVSNNIATIAYAGSGYSYQYDLYQTNRDIVTGHKYFVRCLVKPTMELKMTINLGSKTSRQKTISANAWAELSDIVESNATGKNSYIIHNNVVLTSGNSYQIKNTMLIDLTQLWGTAIADYIYSLEQATAGSGIAKLKEWGFFTKDYYAYNTGALQSVKTSGKKCVGFNQWDEEWEAGGLNPTNGETTADSDKIRSKNYNSIIPNTVYYSKTVNPALIVCFYDSSKNFIGYVSGNNTSFTTPTNASYYRIRIGDGSNPISSYNNDVCINISNPNRNGEYEPYTEKTYSLSNVDLRGLFKLDSNNNLYADGDEYTPDGNVKRKYGIVDLGSLTWTKYDITGGALYRALSSDIKYYANPNITPNFLCAKYVTVASVSRVDMTMSQGVAGSGCVDIIDSSYSDAATFKTAMNGVYLIYELATPTTETTTPYNETMLVDGDGTEEFLDSRDIPVPVGHESGYNQAIKGLPTAPTADGTYKLRCTVSNGVPSFSWVSDT